jgi:hypothetical protein
MFPMQETWSLRKGLPRKFIFWYDSEAMEEELEGFQVFK